MSRFGCRDWLLVRSSKERSEALKTDIVQIIKCIILSSSQDMTMYEINKDFEDVEGERIPLRMFGFLFLDEFFNSMRGIFKVDKETDVVSLVDKESLKKSSHIRKMVISTKDKSKNRQRFVSRAPRAFYTPKDSAPGTIPEVFCTLKDLENRDLFVHHRVQLHALRLVNNSKGLLVKHFESELNQYLFGKINEMYGDVHKLLSRLSHLFYVRNHKIYPNLKYYPDEVRNFGLEPDNSTFVPLVPLRVKVLLCELMESYPHGVLWYDVLPLYQKHFGFPLDYALHGFPGVSQMIMSMPLFRCEKIDEEYYFFDVRKPYPPAAQVTPGAIENITKMLALFNEGIDLEYFLPLYDLIYRVAFKYEAMKFATLESALESLQSRGVEIVSREQDQFVVLNATNLTLPTRRHPFMECDRPKCIVYPDGVMCHGDLVPQVVFPDDLGKGMYISVKCVDSFSPHHFFAQIKDDPFVVMDGEMKSHYQKHGKELKIPFNACTVGLFCTCFYKNTYMRVIIVAFSLTGPDVLALKIDFGGLMPMEREWLYYLPKKFGEMPAQAFLCNLHDISVAGRENFSCKCTKYFHSLTVGKSTAALIHKVDRKTMEATVRLCSRLNGKLIDVARHLSNCKLASAEKCHKPIRERYRYAVWLLYHKLY